MKLQYHPIFATHFTEDEAPVYAEDIRREWRDTVWAFDPWLGTTRSIAEVLADPQGFNIPVHRPAFFGR